MMNMAVSCPDTSLQSAKAPTAKAFDLMLKEVECPCVAPNGHADQARRCLLYGRCLLWEVNRTSAER